MALRIKSNVDLKELEKFDFSTYPNRIYSKSIGFYIDTTGNRTEKFIIVDENRNLRKYKVESYNFITIYAKELHLFKRNVKDLIEAGLVEKC